jgi:hypothetical protein
MKNLLNEIYRFNQRCLWPVIAPPQFCLLYMVQCGEYILSPDFVSTYKKIDLHELEALWDMVHSPSKATISMIMKLVFDQRSYGKKFGCRYFVASIHSSVHDDPDPPAQLRDDEEVQEEHSSSSEETSSDSSKDVNGQRKKSKIERMIDLCRSRPRTQRDPQYPDTDFVELPEDDPMLFTLDRKGEDYDHTDMSFDCPDNIEDMLVVVRNLREQRHRALAGFRYKAPTAISVPPEQASQSSSQQKLPRKRGYDSGRCPNMSDMT